MRARIYLNEQCEVILEYDDSAGERRKRVFELRGRYVQEMFYHNRTYSYVCDGLQYNGATLECLNSHNFLNIIRREYRKMRRIEKKLESGCWQQETLTHAATLVSELNSTN